jgi:uncharacterized membrane protein
LVLAHVWKVLIVNWSAYEVFAVISGLAMVVVAIVPLLEMKERLVCAACGVLFAGYGIYVASQEYGTFTFPVFMYILPIGAVLRAGLVWHERRISGTGASRTDDPS